MKPLSVIGLFLFALVACVKVPEPVEGPTLNNTPSPNLAAIDSLMWHQPDSALTLLLPWFDTCCRDAARHVSTATAYNRHYANLLLAELLYKNYYPQTNRAELQQAVAYFDSLVGTQAVDTRVADTRGVSLQGRSRRDARRASAKNATPTNVFLDARAHYINGVGYYENDSAVPACKEYMKALEAMEGRFEEKELVEKKAAFMALTHTHLTELFSNLYLHEQALYYGKLSLKYYQKYDAETWHIAWGLDEIGMHYDMLGDYDSACYYYNQGLKILSDTNNLNYRDLTTHLAFLSYKKGNNPKSSLKQLYSILAQTESNQEYASRCLTIGEIFYREKEFDSAWIYLINVYEFSSTSNLKKQAAEWLVEIGKVKDKNEEIYGFASFLAPFANLEENQSATKSQLTELYKDSVQTKVNRQNQLEANRYEKQVIIIIGSLLFIMLIIILLYIRNKCHKRKLEVQMETERHAHRIQQAALAGRLRQSNAALKEQGKLASSITTRSFAQHSMGTENYVDEPICQHILALCNDKKNPIKSTVPIAAYSKIALTDAQKAQLKDAAMHHYGSLFEKLKQQYPELKEKDLQYCYLSLLGLDNVEIAVVLQHSISTIWERENRLKKFLGSRDRVAVILHGLMIN